jgi:hypothetical protein
MVVDRGYLRVDKWPAAGDTSPIGTYDLDQLGWLQFEQLGARLLEREAGIPQGDWVGSADRCRHVLSETALGPPLLEFALPGPVLIQCAWIRPGSRDSVKRVVTRIADQQPEQVAAARSFLLICNGDLLAPLREAAGNGRIKVGVLGRGELGARVDARPDLRLAMPSLLGLRSLEKLISPEQVKRSSLELPAAHRLAEVFVPTRPHRRALAVLAAHGFAVLTGPPEMGKTAIARMVALAKLTDGWEAHECTAPDDVWRALDPGRSQVFIADDAFGSAEYRADAAELWARALERLLHSLDDRHWLIWTSRPAPLHAALRRLHRERGAERFPAPARVLVDAGDLDVVEKTLILFRHAKAAPLPSAVRNWVRNAGPDIVANQHFTPERIRRLIARLSRGETDVMMAVQAELTRATEAMEASFETLGIEHRDLLVALLDTPPGPVPERELAAALRRHHDGSLSHPPAELVDRLADHFLRVLA